MKVFDLVKSLFILSEVIHLQTAKYLLVKVAHDKSTTGTNSDFINGNIFSISCH